MNVSELPTMLALTSNYPNPFNPSTTIDFTVPRDGRAVVKVFDMLGKEVATVFNDAAVPGKQYAVPFNASALASGVYVSQLEFAGGRVTKQMILLK